MYLGILSFTALAGDDTAAGIVGLVVIVLLALTALAFYFLPTIIAIFRDHHQLGVIAVINLFFGWTFIGWVVSLAWSVSATREK